MAALRLLKNLEVTEEKCLVLHHWSADGRAVLVLGEMAAGNAVPVVEVGLASSELLRRYSHTSPWNGLVPDLMVALMTAPAEVPNSAE